MITDPHTEYGCKSLEFCDECLEVAYGTDRFPVRLHIYPTRGVLYAGELWHVHAHSLNTAVEAMFNLLKNGFDTGANRFWSPINVDARFCVGGEYKHLVQVGVGVLGYVNPYDFKNAVRDWVTPLE